jgi:hypothetical protein
MIKKMMHNLSTQTLQETQNQNYLNNLQLDVRKNHHLKKPKIPKVSKKNKEMRMRNIKMIINQ